MGKRIILQNRYENLYKIIKTLKIYRLLIIYIERK
nr:MAG TPA: hypothetical protein [Caudoviricetes sp.]